MHDFVSKHINSVEQIAVLMLLRTDASREWSIAELSAELRSAASAIERRLNDLRDAGVLAPGPRERVRFEPASPEMARAIEELVSVYVDRPNRVIELIYSKPATSLEAFADAFKLRKDKG